MPSREEIVGWLKKEGDSTSKIWADLIGPERAEEKAAKWYQRAAQVENMRCETCDRYVTGEDDEACTFNQIEYQGLGFGCFVHKPKEVNK